MKVLGMMFAAVLLLAAATYGSMRAGWWNSDYQTLVARYAAPPSQIVALDGARIHFRDEGRGRPVLFLHGSGESLHQWDHVATLLGDKYRIIRMDWAPYGLTVDSRNGNSTPRAAELVAALVDHLQLDKFVLVATSNGGNVALAYAAAHPEHLEAMAFSVLPIAPLKPDRPSSARVKFMTWFFPKYLPDYHPKWYYRAVFEETTKPGVDVDDRDLEAVYEQENLPGAAARQAAYIEANRQVFRTGDAGAAAEKITVPVLIQWCDLDTVIVPKSRGDQAAARFVLAPVTLIHYPDIGHFPMYEDPRRYSRDLAAFIDRLPPWAVRNQSRLVP